MVEEMKLSVVIPAQDEAGSIAAVLEELAETLEREQIDYELLVIDDDSQDTTAAWSRRSPSTTPGCAAGGRIIPAALALRSAPGSRLSRARRWR